MPQTETAEYWLIFTKNRPGLLATLWEAMEDFENRYPNLRIGWNFMNTGFEPMIYHETD